jgi:hypothetical protein
VANLARTVSGTVSFEYGMPAWDRELDAYNRVCGGDDKLPVEGRTSGDGSYVVRYRTQFMQSAIRVGRMTTGFGFMPPISRLSDQQQPT